MTQTAIFPVFYLPPISYFKALKLQNLEVCFEIYEHFPKQTFRNRAQIYSPNGRLNLTIPIQKGKKIHTLMRDVKICYHENWQRLHWMSLQTCYRNSAYFEYYESEFECFYTQRIEKLVDYNMEFLKLITKFLKLNLNFQFTQNFQKEVCTDFREVIHPKKDALFQLNPYYQVFEEKHGFINDLSIVDLLFNKGPQASQWI